MRGGLEGILNFRVPKAELHCIACSPNLLDVVIRRLLIVWNTFMVS